MAYFHYNVIKLYNNLLNNIYTSKIHILLKKNACDFYTFFEHILV
jgi:hypothetical protein